METILHDLQFALRNLRNARGFTAVAIVTLALGIGATTAMFSVVNAVLLRPLPFRSPDQLVALGEFDTREATGKPRTGNLSYPDFADIRDRNRSFESVAAYQTGEYTLTGLTEAAHVQVGIVSSGMFRLLGVRPSLGRDFLAGEDAPGKHVAILSAAFWRGRFNADPDVIGRSINLNGRALAIVGVMPAGFQFPILSEARDMWVTFSREAESDDPRDIAATAQRGNHSLQSIARLKPGVSLTRAGADLASISRALAAEYPKSNSYTGIAARPELESLTGDTSTQLLVLFAAVSLVLLIACANIANLLLARGTSRWREMAIRASLGATRTRIVRQLLTESIVLAVAGAALGVELASWALSGVLHLYPANLPRAQEVGIDLCVLLFVIGVALVTGILFGLAPALHASSPSLTNAMREGGRTTTGPRHTRLRAGLVIAETALGVMLLIGAGLLLRSFDRLSRVNLGFNPRQVLTASFDLSEVRYNSDQQDRFVHELFSRLRSVPGVISAAGSLPLPLYQDGWSISFNLLDHPVSEANEPSAGFYLATPGFFETMQIPLFRGRTFDERDQRNSAPVMIITQAFAKKFFPNQDPIGRRVKIGAGEGAARESYRTRQIVGVVGDIRTSKVSREPGPAYYIPLSQLMWAPPTVVVRTAGNPNTVVPEMRRIISSMDRDAPLYAVRSMDDYLALDLGRARFQTVLLGLFAGIALLLTAVGLYGVIAYAVAERTHEIGIRTALGASRNDVLRLVMRRGIVLTVPGVGIGVLGALALVRFIDSLLYATRPVDALTYFSVCGILLAVGLVASYIPALRAARVDPTVALRYQ